MYIILFSIFDAEQSRIVSIKKLCLLMYNIQYRMTVHILITRSVPTAILEMDRPIISIKLKLLLCKLNLYA